jgi:hypothetical protein
MPNYVATDSSRYVQAVAPITAPYAHRRPTGSPAANPPSNPPSQPPTSGTRPVRNRADRLRDVASRRNPRRYRGCLASHQDLDLPSRVAGVPVGPLPTSAGQHDARTVCSAAARLPGQRRASPLRGIRRLRSRCRSVRWAFSSSGTRGRLGREGRNRRTCSRDARSWRSMSRRQACCRSSDDCPVDLACWFARRSIGYRQSQCGELSRCLTEVVMTKSLSCHGRARLSPLRDNTSYGRSRFCVAGCQFTTGVDAVAAAAVLRKSMAMVIGPTPPGTGVIAPAT